MLWSVLSISTETLRKAQSVLRKLTILIDPGHGGIDGGTQDYRGNLEKDINLSIGLHLKNQLQQSGLNVLITRESDVDLSPFISGKKGRHQRDLLARIKMAKENNSLLLISLHCDYSTASYRYGAVAFYNYLSPISKEFALAVQEEVNKIQRKPQKAVPGKYYLIRQHKLTGIIIEVGFLSNHEEADLLQDVKYQEKLALAIGRGILKKCQTYTTSLVN